jgi:flagellar biosynthesis/type III secretory pathway protein FliH
MTEDIQARARRWLAEFDGYADEDVLLDLAEPLIRDLLAAVESAREDGYRQGYDEGRVEGYDAAVAEAEDAL